MRIKNKKIALFLIMLLICIVTLFEKTPNVQAAEDKDVSITKYGTAIANTEVSYDFTVTKNEKVEFSLVIPVSPKYTFTGDYTFTINDSSGNVYETFSITREDWTYVEGIQTYAYKFFLPNMPLGDYVIKFVTTADTSYSLYINCDVSEKPNPYIYPSIAEVTVGMKLTLEVRNTDEKITWKSSKKEITTVNKKGIVTGKKKGTATITATTESGEKLKCEVTVKPNKYEENKIQINVVTQWGAALQVCSASYNKEGDLVLKCRFANNTMYDVTALQNLKIKFVTEDNKTIGTYSTSKKKISIPSYMTKDFTLKIKKSKLKIKKADLRTASYTVEGKYEYNTYITY